MTANPDQPALPAVLPAFEPVARNRMRRGGWSAARQREFIELLAETGSVRSACRRMGVGEYGVYNLRRRPDAASFRAAWETALDLGVQRLEDIAMDRALNGVEEPVYSYGELVGTRVVHNDRLLMFLLRNRAPERFADGKARALSAVDAAELKRLKAQWKQEWEREQAYQHSATEAGNDGRFAEQLAALHRRWFTGMGPNSRAAYRAFREAEALDQALLAAVPGDGAAPNWVSDEDDLRSAEADYAEWFTDDRRGRVWQMVDLVFAAATADIVGED